MSPPNVYRHYKFIMAHLNVNLTVIIIFYTLLVQAYYQPSRHQQTIDYWRQYPDTTGLCSAPGFKRNETDCTQFYRYKPIQFSAYTLS